MANPQCPLNRQLRVRLKLVSKSSGAPVIPDIIPQWGTENASVFTTTGEGPTNNSALIQPHKIGTAKVSVTTVSRGRPINVVQQIDVVAEVATDDVVATLEFDQPI